MEQERFSKKFLWGAATSSHQVEGGNHNDWSEWELQNAERLAKEAEKRFGSLPSWPMIKAEATRPENYISGRACDHYHRFREDFDIAKSLGHNAHRFSIEWSRIEPEEGKFDEKEIEHYREVIAALRERGLEPFVTLWHWTHPLWIRNQGGWKNSKTVTDYVRFGKRVMGEFRDIVKHWQPLNEPNIYTAFGYVMGAHPPGEKNILHARRVSHNLMRAHQAIYQIGHTISPDFKIGISHAVAHRVPYRNYFWNRFVARVITYLSEDRFLQRMSPYADFLGIQYYKHEPIALRLGGERLGIITLEDEIAWKSDLGWQIYPEGIYHAIKKFQKYQKPLYITENGIADARDTHRGKFIREHLSWVEKAITGGADVRGYFHWSLLDNFEIPEVRGFWPRFGLVEVDYGTFRRTIRQSAHVYREIIERTHRYE